MVSRSACTIGAVVGLLLLALPAEPVRAEGPERPARGGLIERHAERLGLDDAAVGQIREIFRSSRARHEDLDSEIRSARQALRSLMDQPTPDSEAILAQADMLGKLEARQQRNRLETILEIRSLLTPEQRQELIRIRDEERPGGWRGHGLRRRCGRDLAASCPDKTEAPDALRCLADHWEELSERCRRSLEPGRRGIPRQGEPRDD